MYLIKTYLSASPIHGVGVFAGEDIPKGTPVWEFTPNFDQRYTPEEFANLPEAARAHIVYHGFKWQGHIYHCGEYGQFTNHSETPNTGNWPDRDSLSETALRDIKKGEEITSNYLNFDEFSHEKLGF